jgi:hypothetical protein
MGWWTEQQTEVRDRQQRLQASATKQRASGEIKEPLTEVREQLVRVCAGFLQGETELQWWKGITEHWLHMDSYSAVEKLRARTTQI